MPVAGQRVPHQPIYVNGRFLAQMVTGTQRFGQEIIRAVDRRLAEKPDALPGATVTILAPPHARKIPGLTRVEMRNVGRSAGKLWDQIELPLSARGGLLVTLCNYGPIVHPSQVVAIHDAAVYANPSNYNFLYRQQRRLMMHINALSARAVVTVSHFSRAELCRHLPVSSDKIHVIPNGADHILRNPPAEDILNACGLERGRYLFAIGSVSRNKNVGLIIEALRLVNDQALRLVVAGGTAPRVLAGYEMPEDQRVITVGYISDAEVRAMYENAMCFVFPSLYEGFGIPPLEAMTCGCPVIASDIPVLRETLGDAVSYCDPHDAGNLAAQIQAVTEKPDLLNELRRRGWARAKEFTWERSAELLLDVIDKVRK